MAENARDPIANKPNQVFAKEISPIKNLEGLLLLLTIVSSLPILGTVIWLFIMKDFDCELLLKLPKLRIGVAIGLLFLFLTSNVALYLRSRNPVVGFFIITIPLMVFLILGLALVGGYKLQSRKIVATPMWLEGKVYNDNNWEDIKECIYESGVCHNLELKTMNLKSSEYTIKVLSSIEAGCCNPPTSCGMNYVNATFWVTDGRAMGVDTNNDCYKWENNKTTLCYDCVSCKQAFVKTLENKWWRLGMFLTIMSLLLIIFHLALFVVVVMMRQSNG